MKASLYSRSNVRLKFFEDTQIPYTVKTNASITYYSHNIEQDTINHYAVYQYIFSGIKSNIPQSDIIIFSNDLPSSYAKTTGSKAGKFSTEPLQDNIVEIKDMILEVNKGKEKISKQPPSFPDSRIKEIETRERQDTIKRKISFNNSGTEIVSNFEFKFTQTKDIRLKNAVPEPHEKDVPEFKWIFDIKPEQTVNIELELTATITKTFEIEKPISGQDNIALQQEQEFYNLQNDIGPEQQAY